MYVASVMIRTVKYPTQQQYPTHRHEPRRPFRKYPRTKIAPQINMKAQQLNQSVSQQVTSSKYYTRRIRGCVALGHHHPRFLSRKLQLRSLDTKVALTQGQSSPDSPGESSHTWELQQEHETCAHSMQTKSKLG